VTFGDLEMLSFPWAQGESNISGALCKTSEMKPGTGGTLVISRVKIVQLKQQELKAQEEKYCKISFRLENTGFAL
jgi:hypothetical protein